MSINIQKMKLLSKVTQRETLSAMPHSQNSIFQLDLQLNLTKYSQNTTIFVKDYQAEIEFLPTR